jgi:hypothetical protein
MTTPVPVTPHHLPTDLIIRVLRVWQANLSRDGSSYFSNLATWLEAAGNRLTELNTSNGSPTHVDTAASPSPHRLGPP